MGATTTVTAALPPPLPLSLLLFVVLIQSYLLLYSYFINTRCVDHWLVYIAAIRIPGTYCVVMDGEWERAPRTEKIRNKKRLGCNVILLCVLVQFDS